MSNGPTLNPQYNRQLATWERQGYPTDPACEDCGRDLTGEWVTLRSWGWICDDCHNKTRNVYVDSDYSERMAERRQMGLSNF
jgi:hypothetical protein